MFAPQTQVPITAAPLSGGFTEHTLREAVSGAEANKALPPVGSVRSVQHGAADPAVLTVSTDQSRPQRESLLSTKTVCETLSNAVVQNANAADLTRAFAQASRQAVVLLDSDCRPIAEAEGTPSGALDDWNRSDGRAHEQLKMLAKECRQIRVPAATGDLEGYGWLVTPIVAVDNLLGYLLVIGEASDAPDDIQVAVAGFVASMFAVTLAREREGNTREQLRHETVLDSLVTGHFLDDADAQRKARVLGVPEQGHYRIAVARLNAAGAHHSGEAMDEDGAFARLIDALSFAAVLRGTELVMLIPDVVTPQAVSPHPSASPPLPDPFEVLRSRLLDDGDFTFGVSEQTNQPGHAPRALAQARHAADLGVRLGRAGQTISYEDLGIYRLLLQIGDLDQLRHYARDVLGPLIDYDAAHKPDLLHTLRTYLDQHGSPKQTARMLRVHVNTVAYRLQRIESLTSLNLATPDDRLSAHVAVKVVESLLARQADPGGRDPSIASRDDMSRVS